MGEKSKMMKSTKETYKECAESADEESIEVCVGVMKNIGTRVEF